MRFAPVSAFGAAISSIFSSVVRGSPPMHFLVTPDLFDTLQDRRIFVAERGETIVGFLVATAIPARSSGTSVNE